MISDLYAFPPDRVAQSEALTGQLIMAHRRLAELKGVAPMRNKKYGAPITMKTSPYSSSCKGITRIDHVHFLANSKHDGFVMFKKPNLSYKTSFSSTKKGRIMNMIMSSTAVWLIKQLSYKSE